MLQDNFVPFTFYFCFLFPKKKIFFSFSKIMQTVVNFMLAQETDRFHAVYPILKEVALAGSSGGKA